MSPFLTSLFLTTILTTSAQELTIQTLDMVDKKYLWLDALDLDAAVISAVEELEMHIPWLIVTHKEGMLRLQVGQEAPFFQSAVNDLTFEEAEIKLLEFQLALKKTAPMDVPSDVDVELVLLDGFAREMDRYSVMMYNDRLTDFNERISGNFSGIGCRVQKREGGLEIQEVFPEGPAAIMGLKEGDVITHVDGVALSALTLQQGVDRLRGDTGSVVKLDFLRGEESDSIALVRAQVRIPNVHWSIQDGIGVITIRNFSEQTMRFMELAVEEFTAIGIQGLVLDLRNNGGGSMLQSCKVVDQFVTSGVTLKTVGRDGERVPGLMKQYLNKNDFDEPKWPMVVLINHNSASASEIVAGSLKLLDRALLIGQTSFGKGVVQTAADLRTDPDPVALKLTIAQYLLSEDYSVHEEDGVEPHIKLGRLGLEELPFVSLSQEPSQLVLLSDGEDKELAFAKDVLKHADGASVEGLQKVAQERIAEWQEMETVAIQQRMSEVEISWQESPVSEAQDLSIALTSSPIVQAGAETEVILTLQSQGPEISQAFLWLQAENSSSPWDDIVVPVGYIPENSEKILRFPYTVPLTTIPRYDKLQPILLRSCCAEIELEPIYIQVSAGIQPQVDLTAKIVATSEHEFEIELLLENTGSVAVGEVYGRIIWPVEARDVRMTDNEWKTEVLKIGEKQPQKLHFSSGVPLDELPELLIRIDSKDVPMLFRQQVQPKDLMVMTPLNPPIINGIPPVSAQSGTVLPFAHSVDDDGDVVTYEAWWNQEKLHWQATKGSVELMLPVEEGHNNLMIEAIDNLGLKTRSHYTVFGLGGTSESAERVDDSGKDHKEK